MMAEIGLRNDLLAATIETSGGTIWKLAARLHGGDIPLLRSPVPGADHTPRNSGCYPLVPFGNRIANNAFTFEGREHALSPNVDWDPLILHGGGWLSEWDVISQSDVEVVLQHRSDRTISPFRYTATQHFQVEGSVLKTTMRVVNTGDMPLPFGIGWHPYFPRAEDTTLEARASSYWEEGDLHLPTIETVPPPDLAFATSRQLPSRWVNNGFEGWDGTARIATPSLGLVTQVEASEIFRRYFVFVPDPHRPLPHPDPFFAFEPMSHSANAHNLTSGGGLVGLQPGEALEGWMSISWQEET